MDSDSAILEHAMRVVTKPDFREEERETTIDRLSRLAIRLVNDSGRREEYLRSICLQSEIHDYYGSYAAAREAIAEQEIPCQKALFDWAKSSPESDRELGLFKQTLWTLVHLAHCHYREKEFDEAQKLLSACREAIAHLLLSGDKDTESQRFYGLRSRIAYSSARICRKLNQLDRARGLYTEAAELQKERLQSKKNRLTNDPLYKRGQDRVKLLAEEQEHTNYSIAKCIGFGWGRIHLQSGELAEAKMALSACTTLLQSANDPIFLGYAEFLYAQVLRGEAQRANNKLLSVAIETLTRLCKDNFKHHAGFRIRAKIELVRAHILKLKGRDDPSELAVAQAAYAHVLEDRGCDGRWRLYVHVLASRLHCHAQEYDKAAAEARETIRGVDAAKDPSLFVTALVGVAEASIKWAKASGDETHLQVANDHLIRAAAIGAGNPLDVAVCHLYLAQIHVCRKDRAGAQRHLANARQYVRSTENGFVKDLADDVDKEVNDLVNTFVILESDVLHYHKHHNNLRLWLLRQAHNRLGTRFSQDAHEELNVARQTIFSWRKELKYLPPDTRGSE